MADGVDQTIMFPCALDDDGPGEWLVECPDCPTIHDAEYGCDRLQQWTFKPGDLPGAKAFAARHRSLQSHEVVISRRVTFTAQQANTTDIHSDIWGQLIGLGDAGDTQGIRL